MSLNAPEIDRILSELDLPGHHVQKVIQPDFRNLAVQFFRPPSAWWLRICLENPMVRFHRTSVPPRARRSHQRFEDFLWSRVRGGRVQAAEHVYRDRIVRLTIVRDRVETVVYLRLWGTRANIIVTEPDGTILDAFFRKPAQGIESGRVFVPSPPAGPGRERDVRPVLPGATLNETVDREYRDRETARDRDRLIARCRKALEKRRRRTEARLAEVEAGRENRNALDRNRHYGDLILANMHLIGPGDRWADVPDYLDENRSVRIELDPSQSPAGNAQAYYDRARRSEESAAYLDASADSLSAQLEHIETQLIGLEDRTIAELRDLAETLYPAGGGSGSAAGPTVGLEFTSGGFRILVGRNARENDELLRRSTRGNDWWLHTRDHPGGYVFVKYRSGKSVPLDVLLDAGNLALFFSKARSAGKADLYYTQVKYLRRAKDGPRGLVIPTQEKNLTVELDPTRLQRLGVGTSL